MVVNLSNLSVPKSEFSTDFKNHKESRFLLYSSGADIGHQNIDICIYSLLFQGFLVVPTLLFFSVFNCKDLRDTNSIYLNTYILYLLDTTGGRGKYFFSNSNKNHQLANAADIYSLSMLEIAGLELDGEIRNNKFSQYNPHDEAACFSISSEELQHTKFRHGGDIVK